jgi:hypothetical protein
LECLITLSGLASLQRHRRHSSVKPDDNCENISQVAVLSYNKLTIGGATGTSTLTISGDNQFTELASTKTVAHTIALGSTTQTFGKWTVTGTAGNVVTLTGTGTAHQLVGACTDGIDYLAMGSIRFAATSPAEFYAGANSTATGSPAAPTYLTDKPADSTRYWVGGTGNWNDTTYWSTSSGGAGGADLPRSHDDVVFDSSSNATAYTATVNAITGGNRCKALTIAGPASGNVTLAGSTALFIHDDITLPATGLTRTYTGAITLSGTGAGKTITTNGVTLSTGVLTLNGVGAEWSLGDALTMGQTSSTFNVFNGSFDTANYNLTVAAFSSNVTGGRSITLGSSTVTLGTNASISFGSQSRLLQISRLMSGHRRLTAPPQTPRLRAMAKLSTTSALPAHPLAVAISTAQTPSTTCPLQAEPPLALPTSPYPPTKPSTAP